jgi:hypothetical protein
MSILANIEKTDDEEPEAKLKSSTTLDADTESKTTHYASASRKSNHDTRISLTDVQLALIPIHEFPRSSHNFCNNLIEALLSPSNTDGYYLMNINSNLGKTGQGSTSIGIPSKDGLVPVKLLHVDRIQKPIHPTIDRDKRNAPSAWKKALIKMKTLITIKVRSRLHNI